MFEHLPDSSRVWIYTADKSLSSIEDSLNTDISQFVSRWAAHGSGLFGDGKIIKNFFLVLVVDESKVGASGCSIDSSVKFIKSLGEKYRIDFFNRLNMVVRENGADSLVHFSELKKYNTAELYDPMITDLGNLRSNWLRPVSKTSYV
jgi:hypothetical protein